MRGVMRSFAVIGLVVFSAAAEPGMSTGSFSAEFTNGALTGLTDNAGTRFAEGAENAGARLHLLSGDFTASSTNVEQAWSPESGAVEAYSGFKGLEEGTIRTTYTYERGSDDLVIVQRAESPKKGLWGAEWSIEGIPLDMNVIVPGNSGLKLTKATPGSSFIYDYPMMWEAQLVIVEGAGRGFYVWAEDARGIFKRLTVDRNEKGWRLGFITMPFAPFEEQSVCESVRWHLNVYEGDWRVPAKRYREWADKTFRPTALTEQQPMWVRDIRCCVIMAMDEKVLGALPSRLDPKQTLLYVYDWRKAGYDRDYPTYDQPYETFEPFVAGAKALGFRVMLHVNYFGCDPLNPLYEKFEPYQIRSPWGDHQKEWWLWERADPVIKFAYINPAYKPWRDELVTRFSKLCRTYSIDALHLDQTLCIYNDYNGLIDGMSMIDGSVALHRELREALPDVALSGEGLDEVTYRYEAFAQRHAWGLNHADGTYNMSQLRAAHPISSYLLRPYTCIYGYLGYAPPTSGQLYAAWNEAYQHWGVIPTLKPNLDELANPTGFSKQFFDEAGLWQREYVEIDMESAWPDEIAFPFRTASGERVVRTADRRLLWGEREVSRTIADVSRVEGPGSIPGWRAYDDHGVIGLDPALWYPYSSEPRDAGAFHVCALPEGYTLAGVSERDTMAVVRTAQTRASEIRFAAMTGDAVCGSKPFNGEAKEARGELHSDDGALFSGSGDVIYAHPPYGISGTGIAYARYTLKMPANAIRFTAEVAMEQGAVGESKSDGVTYRVSVRAGEYELHAEVHNATIEHRSLELDVTPFAGKETVLELSVDPGPAHNPSFDWARWYEPRIVTGGSVTGEIGFAGLAAWKLALSGASAIELSNDAKTARFTADFPGSVYFLKSAPPVATLPLDVAAAERQVTYLNDAGMELNVPMHACAQPGESTVGGVTRSGLFTHPPDNGRTVVDIPMTVPDTPAEFHSWIGLRDGSKSKGVDFIVQMNGTELARIRCFAGAWQEIVCDLAPCAGKPAVLTLIADSAGDYVCDWAQWGEPRVRPR